MRFAAQGLLGIAALSVVTGGAARATNTYQRYAARTSSDICANVDAELKVKLLGIDVGVGLLR